MNTTRLSQARRLFCSPYVPRSVNRRNALAWVRQVRNLGPKWVALPKEQA